MNNKELIQKVALDLFVKDGFEQTKISDISRAVGISDSTIYEHFKNKQELLRMIPIEKQKEMMRINEQSMRGLIGAETKLRKLLWNYFEYLSEHKSYAHLFVFELRRDKHFYDKDNKSLAYEFTRIYRSVIKEGQDNGEFRPEISPQYILKLIFGTIDNMVITWLINEKAVPLIDNFEAFFDLVLHAIASRYVIPKNMDKKQSILDAAIKVFAEVGYNKARIQDIAKIAGVADGTIYQYFRNKQDILFDVATKKTEEVISTQNQLLNGIKDSDYKLKVLIYNYLMFFDSNKDYNYIVVFELRYNREFYNQPIYQLFRTYAKTFSKVIKQGIKSKDFRSSVNPLIATQMIFGTIDHIALTWHLFNKPQHMRDSGDALCDLILHAVTRRT